MASRRFAPLIAALLVLWHAFGPGAHALQHRWEHDRAAAAAAESAFGCGCAAHQCERELRCGSGPTGLPRLTADADGQDCGLCGELQRCRGWIAPPVAPPTVSTAGRIAVRLPPCVPVRTLRPIAASPRGPPFLRSA